MSKLRLPLWFAARFYWAISAIALLLACSPGVAVFLPLAIAGGVGLIVALVADIALGPQADAVTVRRRIPDHLALRNDARIVYDITNAGAQAIRASVREAPMRTLVFAEESPTVEVRGGERASVERIAHPVARGREAFGALYVWYENRIGLLRRRLIIESTQHFRVYPDLSAVARYGALHVRNRLLEAGVRRMRLRGTGMNFESLREYVDGDAFRTIDWKATARRGKMMVVQHEVERSQDVMLLLDCGRLMTAKVGNARKLDYAITAALSLASIASLAHDRVGVVAFAGTLLAARAPRSTAASIHALTDAIGDLEPRFEESDYARAIGYLRGNLHRRSLIVLFTDVIDPVAQSTVLAELASLAKHHRVLCIFMNDAAVTDALAVAPSTIDDAYRLNVAVGLATERAQAARTLARRNIGAIDVPAPKLAAATIDEYLKIKARGAV